MSDKVRTGEILFVKSVKDGIPNRDPLRDSDARRLFSEEDGRISLSDVSIKRDVRDYVLAKYPEGGCNNNMYVFCREERTPEGRLLGRSSLAEKILERANKVDAPDKKKALLETAFDIRVFGAVYSVKGETFNQTGPVQFGWAHSMHPVETQYVQGTVVIPSEDIKVSEVSEENQDSEGNQDGEEGEETGAKAGTIWSSYILPFAVFCMPGVINANLANATGMTTDDLDILLNGLWEGTMIRQARGRGIQQPLFLLHVEYNDPFFRIGYLEEYINLLPREDAWRGEKIPTSLKEISLDLQPLSNILTENRGKIARIQSRFCPGLKIEGKLPEVSEGK